MNFKLLTLLVITIFSTNLNAAVFDGGNFVQDTNTQLDWLKVSFTQGKSFDEVSSLIANDSFYSGYQLAGREQVKTLFNNYYGEVAIGSGSSIDSLNYNKTFGFVNLLGLTREIQDSNIIGLPVSVDRYFTTGYVAEPYVNNKHRIVEFVARDYFVSVGATQDSGKFSYKASPYDDDEANELISSFLVRSSVVSLVPEPSTYAMMVLGLFGIAGMNRRNKQA